MVRNKLVRMLASVLAAWADGFKSWPLAVITSVSRLSMEGPIASAVKNPREEPTHLARRGDRIRRIAALCRIAVFGVLVFKQRFELCLKLDALLPHDGEHVDC